jgi:hypothetical protein
MYFNTEPMDPPMDMATSKEKIDSTKSIQQFFIFLLPIVSSRQKNDHIRNPNSSLNDNLS